MKKCLIVVDFQKDFVNGALGFSGAEKLEERILEKLDAALADKNDIIFTFDTHEPDYLQTQEGRKLPKMHCLRNSGGWELYGQTAVYLPIAKAVFEKNTFGSLDLANFLRTEQYDTVELVGLVSNICILSNAILAKAALPEAEILVDAACTASFDKSMHTKALDIMNGVHIHVVNR